MILECFCCGVRNGGVLGNPIDAFLAELVMHNEAVPLVLVEMVVGANEEGSLEFVAVVDVRQN